jgi:hypothetical protein
LIHVLGLEIDIYYEFLCIYFQEENFKKIGFFFIQKNPKTDFAAIEVAGK